MVIDKAAMAEFCLRDSESALSESSEKRHRYRTAGKHLSRNFFFLQGYLAGSSPHRAGIVLSLSSPQKTTLH